MSESDLFTDDSDIDKDYTILTDISSRCRKAEDLSSGEEEVVESFRQKRKKTMNGGTGRDYISLPANSLPFAMLCLLWLLHVSLSHVAGSSTSSSCTDEPVPPSTPTAESEVDSPDSLESDDDHDITALEIEQLSHACTDADQTEGVWKSFKLPSSSRKAIADAFKEFKKPPTLDDVTRHFEGKIEYHRNEITRLERAQQMVLNLTKKNGRE